MALPDARQSWKRPCWRGPGGCSASGGGRAIRTEATPGSLGRTLREEWKRALGAAAISLIGYSLILKAYETAPASYVVAVRQASVLFVLALSIALLGERPGRLRILGAIATVVGVALVAVAG